MHASTYWEADATHSQQCDIKLAHSRTLLRLSMPGHSTEAHLVAVLCEHDQLRLLLLDGAHTLVQAAAQAVVGQRLLQHVGHALVQVWLP